ncbi:MAG: uroporphyrinogen-III synthase [Aquamicrobium sp.]|nr:uroporphyrinogen-III synthase [Aquamicrobium sp.]
MKRRVLVTRPEPGASETAARLEALGFETVVLPLTHIVPLDAGPAPDPHAVDAVAVTSVNALRHASPAMIAILSGKPVFAVGDATAEAALHSGFAAASSASGTAVDLAAMIAARMPAGSRILHLAGRERTEGFAEALYDRGFDVRILEVYSAEKVSYTTDFLMETFAPGPIWGTPVFSTRGAMLLRELLDNSLLAYAFEKTRIFCISRKVAEVLAPVAGDRICVSDEPTEDSIMVLLSSQR